MIWVAVAGGVAVVVSLVAGWWLAGRYVDDQPRRRVDDWTGRPDGR